MKPLFRIGVLSVLAVFGLASEALHGEEDAWVNLLPVTAETEAAAAKALDGCVPDGPAVVGGVNRNGVYMLMGDLFRNGSILAVIGDRMTVTICQWQAGSWKAVHSLDVGIGWDHPGRLAGGENQTPARAKPFWMMDLQNRPLLAIASDEGKGRRNYYTVMFDAAGEKIVDASRSVAFPPVVKHDYLVTREEFAWRDSTTRFSQIQGGRLVERRTWEKLRLNAVCYFPRLDGKIFQIDRLVPANSRLYSARLDGKVFEIVRDETPERRMFSVLESKLDPATPGGAKPVRRADWVIYTGQLANDVPSGTVTVGTGTKPWARVYCHRTGSHRESSEETEAQELAYLFEKLTGLPRDLYPAVDDVLPLPNGAQRRLRVRVTGDPLAIDLLSTGRIR